MTWETHQAHGFFGFTLTRTGPQPRWRHKVEVEQALQAAPDIREAFFAWLSWPEAQPFSGGLLDAWPARMARGLGFCRREWAAVKAFLESEGKEKGHG